MEATILHADVDSFFASVEQRDDARLRGRPVIVGAGVVLAASYEAKAYGIRTAMGGRQARRLCPHAIVVSPRMAAYTEASKAMFRGLRGRDAARRRAVDRRGVPRRPWHAADLAGTPAEIAARLRRDVRDRVGLPITVGVARTKFLAKVASGVAKPDGLLVVPPDGELDFLHPLPVERLWGVGPKTAERLHDRGIRTVGQVAQLPQEALVAMLGRASGRHLHALAHNHDRRRVRTGRRRGSIGSQRALGRRTRSREEIDATLVALVDRVTGRMRRAGRAGRTVVLRLRFDDFARATRSHTLPRATAETEVILRAARALLASAQDLVDARGLTLIGLAVANLQDARAVQLVLPFDAAGGAALDQAVDEIRDRYGTAAITRAVLLRRRARPGDAAPARLSSAPVVEHERVRPVERAVDGAVHGDPMAKRAVSAGCEPLRSAPAREAHPHLEPRGALDRRERLACVEERVEASGVVAEPDGGELHVARPVDRLRARPDVADGEACDLVAVAGTRTTSPTPCSATASNSRRRSSPG